MKTEVYSWRLSAQLKTALEEQARAEGKSFSALLGELASEGLRVRRNVGDDEEAQQAVLRRRVMGTIGTIKGGDPSRSARTSELLRKILVRKHDKDTRVSRPANSSH